MYAILWASPSVPTRLTIYLPRKQKYRLSEYLLYPPSSHSQISVGVCIISVVDCKNADADCTINDAD